MSSRECGQSGVQSGRLRRGDRGQPRSIGAPRRIVFVTPISPFAEPSGGQLRASNTLAGLSRVGQVDVVKLNFAGRQRNKAGEQAGVRTLDVGLRGAGRAALLTWYLFSRRPLNLWRVKQVGPLSDVIGGSPDVCWYLSLEALRALPPAPGAVAIVDVNDLPDRLEQRSRQGRSRRGIGRLRDVLMMRRSTLAWQAEYDRCRHSGIRLVACSEEDAEHLGQAFVVPNGMAGPPSIVERPKRSDRTRAVFVGRLTYGPNREAAMELVREIWPALMADGRDRCLDLVGAYDAQSMPMGDDTVRFLGHVVELEPLLNEADITIMPIRNGGGTRLKVLEAFAHGIPVVATGVAVEGLGAIPDVHYLRAESVADFARQARRLEGNPSLGKNLAREARELFQSQFSEATVVDRVEAVARASVSMGVTLGRT